MAVLLIWVPTGVIQYEHHVPSAPGPDVSCGYLTVSGYRACLIWNVLDGLFSALLLMLFIVPIKIVNEPDASVRQV